MSRTELVSRLVTVDSHSMCAATVATSSRRAQSIRRVPGTSVPGFIGAYPNAFYVVEESGIANFVNIVSSLQSEEDYAALLDVYGIRRTNPDFWRYSDAFQLAYWKKSPLESGLLDYNRLENR